MNTAAQSLYDTIRDAVTDRRVAAVATESLLEPVAGRGSRIQPVTYTEGSYATSEEFIPTQATDGWHTDVVRDNGRPLLAPAVLIDSVGSQANRAETALWGAREEIGGLPGVIVRGTDVPDEEIAKAYASATKGKLTGVAISLDQFRQLIAGTEISTWDASHRHSDAWIRYASVDESGATAWSREGGLRELIAGANSTQDATTLFEHFINSLIFGFWTSSGVIQRHRQARVYSSEIVGYNARPTSAGAGKYELLPVSNKVATTATADGFSSEAKATVPKAARPSTIGFGMVPSDAQPKGFVCETILRRASVSLSALRGIRFSSDSRNKTTAAACVVVALSILGHELSAYETAMRSGCDLLTVERRYGLRRNGVSEVQTFDLPDDVDPLFDLVAIARREAEAVGLRFAEPIIARLSASELGLVAASAVVEAAKGEDRDA